MSGLTIQYKDPRRLKPRTNARTHTSKQINRIAASIKEFGFITPVLVDESDRIIAGHARVETAKRLGMSDVPTVCVDHLTPAQIRAYVIADNRLAELAGWDSKLLAVELQELSLQPNFDVTMTGFDTAEIDIVIGEQAGSTPAEEEKLPEIDRTAPATSQPGDIWQIGPHRLLCASALEQQSYRRLLGKAKARLVFTDPPYNLSIKRALRANSRRRREFAMASGEMTQDEYKRFLTAIFRNLCAASVDGSIHFVCIDWRHVGELLKAADSHYAEVKNICVWTKANAGMGSFYRSQHEFVCVLKNGTAPHTNNVELGRFGRNRSNVWPYPSPNGFGRDSDACLEHPTVKPVPMVADAIMDCSKRGANVLDAFAGSGTTLIAAEQTGRVGYGIEVDPHYVDAILRRLDDVFGLKAIHVDSNKKFEEVRAQRIRR
jgi:DNA modification methylase